MFLMWCKSLCQRLAHRILHRRDGHAVVLFVMASAPQFAVLAALSMLALFGWPDDKLFSSGALWRDLGVTALALAWLLWIGGWAWRRRHLPDLMPTAVQAALWPSLLGMTWMAWQQGLTDSPMGLMLLSQWVFARAVFAWRQVRVAVLCSLLAVLLSELGAWQGWWPVSPILVSPLQSGGVMPEWWRIWTRVVFWSSALPLSVVMFYHAHLFNARRRLLETYVRTDPLTGLYNRRVFMAELEREGARQRRTGEALSLLMCDVDLFKQINDRYGHPAGDQVLMALGQVFRDHLRSVDIAARYGGEEFVVMLPNTTPTQAWRVANNLCAALRAKRFGAPNAPFVATMSVGVAPVVQGDVADALRLADVQLYEAKRAGRDRVEGGAPPCDSTVWVGRTPRMSERSR